MKQVLSLQFHFSNDDIEHLLSFAKKRKFKKHQFLLNPDKNSSQIFFIEKGFIRGYRIIDGIEITHHFFLPNWFASDYQAYLNESKGTLFLEALEDSTILVFEKERLEKLYKTHPKIAELGRIIAEKAYLEAVHRLVDFQTNDLEQRYLSLTQKRPDLFNSIPQKYIASYLGVRPQSLSRIRGKIHRS